MKTTDEKLGTGKILCQIDVLCQIELQRDIGSQSEQQGRTYANFVCARSLCDKNLKIALAIYHLTVKTISRSAGRSATAAAAYRAGVEITDKRTGEVYDFTRKGGVVSADLVLPAGAPAWARDRTQFWNAVEQAETRKNSTVAREFEVALPAELSADDRVQLARDFAAELVARHGFAADVAIHLPGGDGDNRNHHSHILLSTRRLTADGFGEKTRELDDLKTGPQLVREWRERWANMGGDALERAGFKVEAERHRAGYLLLPDQVEAARARGDVEFVYENEGRAPTRHLGPHATGFERRVGRTSRLRLELEQEASDRLRNAKQMGELERQERQLEASIIDLSGDLAAARKTRDRLHHGVDEGMQRVEERFVQWEACKQAEHERQKQAKAAEQEPRRRAESVSRLHQLGLLAPRTAPDSYLDL